MATAVTQLVWPVSRLPIWVLVVRSQTRTVRSSLPVIATGRPSGSTKVANARTQRVWPVRGSPIWVPVVRSQTRTVPSALPVTATRRPSGSTPVATACTSMRARISPWVRARDVHRTDTGFSGRSSRLRPCTPPQ